MEHSPFGLLPRELRDKIYEHAVVHDQGIKIKPSTHSTNNLIAAKVVRTHWSENTTLALAKACRQLYKETIGLYFQLNTFYFPFDWMGVELLKLFLRSLNPEHHNKVRHIVFLAPEKHIRWNLKDTESLMVGWDEVVHQIVNNAATLLPGPISVAGRFTIDRGPIKPDPMGHFDLVLDMNHFQQSMEEHWLAALEVDSYGYPYWGHNGFHKLLERMDSFVAEFYEKYEEDYIGTRDAEAEGGEETATGDADDHGDESNGELEDVEMDEYGTVYGSGGEGYVHTNENDDGDEVLEDGKMVSAFSCGDRYFAQASGLRF